MEGIISKIYYEGENGFVIARFNMANNQGCTILGEMVGLNQGDTICINKYRIESHKDYGRQLRVLSWNKKIPTTKQGVIGFFQSGLVEGVGGKRANMIVDALGENAIELICEKGPDVLKTVSGIGPKLSQNIYNAVMENKQLQGIVQELSSFGMTFNMSMKAYKHFGPGVVDIIRLNPYKLIELNMVSFAKADAIAKNMGIEPQSSFRISAAIQHVFKHESQKNGHCYLLLDEVLAMTMELLGKPEVSSGNIVEVIESQIIQSKLKLEGKCLYDCSHYDAETELAASLRKVKGLSMNSAVVLGAVISSLDLNNKIDVKLSLEQRKAVEMVFLNGLSVLTGGPGTGKTQTIKAVIVAAQLLGLKRVLLSAPTGRAAKVLSSVTGYDAQTLHRLLIMQPGGKPVYNSGNVLPCDLLVIDEASMIDLFLARDVFQALPEKAHVLLVGDRDQLPPVGPGNVFKDILAARVPQVNLTRIYRQSETSAIVTSAHAVNNGTMPKTSGASDIVFINKPEPADVVDAVACSYQKLLQKGFTLEDIQVLSPMRRGETGVDNLNKVLQEMSNGISNSVSSSKSELIFGKNIYRVGDKVMQVKNDYNKQVYNGEIGIISHVCDDNDEEGEWLAVRYNEHEVLYRKDELSNLSLAYAMTVHKSQGCEYPVVILALTTQHYVLLARNLVYTAISRAKEMLVMVGTKKALAIAIKNDRVLARNTMLTKRLRDAFDKNLSTTHD